MAMTCKLPHTDDDALVMGWATTNHTYVQPGGAS
jgi:hypothetical protein